MDQERRHAQRFADAHMSHRNGTTEKHDPKGERVSVDIHIRIGERLETFLGKSVRVKHGQHFDAIDESFRDAQKKHIASIECGVNLKS